MNRGEEDYVKAIYSIEYEEGKGHFVTNQALADELSHSAQTVSEMVKKLNKRGLIKYTPYKGSTITEAGKEAAVRLIRIHRTWELFLVKCLGFTWDQVHMLAEGLEHVTTDLMEERLYHFLGNPIACPAGDPIPDLEGNWEERKGMKLWTGSHGQCYAILRVAEEQPLLKYLTDLDINIDNQVEIIRRDEVSALMELSIQGRRVTLGQSVTEKIYVKQC